LEKLAIINYKIAVFSAGCVFFDAAAEAKLTLALADVARSPGKVAAHKLSRRGRLSSESLTRHRGR